MGNYIKIFILLLFYSCTLFAQEKDTLSSVGKNDSLYNVVVTAFNLKVKWEAAPMAVSITNKQQLQILSNTSLVPVFNTIPGVRMEERSPGSYRLSIRGSLLRSPFGVRNIKVYWNDIPFTDAGGNTYLQLVDANQLWSAEIIKGPTGSLYGANTGGAVILHSSMNAPVDKNTFNTIVSGGSYGLFNEYAQWTYANRKFQSNLQQSHYQSDGYRQQSAMRRDAVKWDGSWRMSKNERLDYITSYVDLHYQTPGGLTLKQLNTDTTAYPLAVKQHAAIYNKTVFSGISLKSTFNTHFDNISSLTLNHTSFENPFTTNYEKRNEWNYGGRTTFGYHTDWRSLKMSWLAGIEWLQNHSHINDFGNKAGVPDTVQFKDELYATQYNVFIQSTLRLYDRLTIQIGFGDNKQLIRYRRLSDTLQNHFINGNTRALLAPRVSLLYNLVNGLNVYAVAAKGFSPPSLAELHPSGGGFNDSLQPERGWNFELGIKGSVLSNRLSYDVSTYMFALKNAIVQRSSPTDVAYFLNAGNTRQNGVEVWMKGLIVENASGFLRSFTVSNSFSYQPYRFVKYQVGTINYDNNRLTGVPKYINVSTLEATNKYGIYANVMFNVTSSIPLTDANDAFAKSYHLLQSKLGFKRHWRGNFFIDLFAGADNLLNEHYSLGNDINAFGKRYYNPAPLRNYFAGINLSW